MSHLILWLVYLICVVTYYTVLYLLHLYLIICQYLYQHIDLLAFDSPHSDHLSNYRCIIHSPVVVLPRIHSFIERGGEEERVVMRYRMVPVPFVYSIPIIFIYSIIMFLVLSLYYY